MQLPLKQNPLKRLVFCDVDGTITAVETFVAFFRGQGVPFVLVSGGLRDMVEKVLSRSHPTKPLIEKIASLSAVKIDTSGDYLRFHSDFEVDTELVAKVKVMEKYSAEQTIAIARSPNRIFAI